MNDLMTKSFLSYVELKKQALKDVEAGPELEMEELSRAEEENLRQFFEEIGEIKAEMEAITGLLFDLQELNEKTKSVYCPTILRGLRDRADSNVVTVLWKARIIKARLEAVDRSNIANRRLSMGCREGTSIDRTRISVTNGLRIKLRELMMDFQSLRETIVSEQSAKRGHFNVTGEEPNEEMIEEMVSAVQKFEKSPEKMDINIDNNQERQKGLKEVYRSMMELHQIFLDMAVLVEAQGEQMDDIEQNVFRSGDYVGDGADALGAANDFQKSRKQVPWAWVFLLVLILVFILSSFASVFKT